MTASNLQSIVRMLANSGWCRYWMNYGDQHKPVTMCVQVVNEKGTPQKIMDADKHGFLTVDDQFRYFAPRTNDDGSLYESKLF